MKSHFDLIKTNPLHKVFVVDLDGIIVGCATIIMEPKFIRECKGCGHIEDVVID